MRRDSVPVQPTSSNQIRPEPDPNLNAEGKRYYSMIVLTTHTLYGVWKAATAKTAMRNWSSRRVANTGPNFREKIYARSTVYTKEVTERKKLTAYYALQFLNPY